MKKLFAFAIVAVMLLALLIPATATEVDGTTYQIGDTVIIFAADSAFNAEQQAAIAELLVTCEDGIDTANILCLFGHKNTTELVTAITHKDKELAPRCKRETYEVTTCSRCDKVSTKLISVTYMSCCPED